ncbi:retrotransposon protein [Striga asiatica]|uniref:Retrotransposon protein n=1 Tax=Striga asiatica TaxID=4170 RepID=A0A5A7PWD1_STRAF|nr:retrotransposon protein [Striga asiatica]
MMCGPELQFCSSSADKEVGSARRDELKSGPSCGLGARLRVKVEDDRDEEIVGGDRDVDRWPCVGVTLGARAGMRSEMARSAMVGSVLRSAMGCGRVPADSQGLLKNAIKQEKEESSTKDVLIICEYLGVSLEELLGRPPNEEGKFAIHLTPEASIHEEEGSKGSGLGCGWGTGAERDTRG